jgi:uncharacterized protein YcfL
MKKFILLFLVSLLLVLASAEEAVESVESDVITLTDKNFDEELKKHEYLLVGNFTF